MKKTLLLLAIGATILFAGCKKDPIIPTPIVGGGGSAVYTLTVDTTGLNGAAVVNPASYDVKSGGSVAPVLQFAPGYRLSSAVLVKGKGNISLNANDLTVKDIASDATLQLKVTDSLTRQQLLNLKANLNQFFRDSLEYSKIDKDVFTQWQAEPLDADASSIHWIDSVTSVVNGQISGIYKEINNSTNMTTFSAPFTISANGKMITLHKSDGDHYTQVVDLTSSQFVYINIDYQPGMNYKFVAVPYKK
jgi:hypothetical protein